MGMCMSASTVQTGRSELLAVRPGSPVGQLARHTMERQLETDYLVHDDVVLGTGMNGSVKLAVGRADGCKYAIKSFPTSILTSQSQRDLKNEADIYLTLDHPHVAQLQMVYETDNALHLVMEHMEGGELFDRVKQKNGFAELVAAKATRQMLLALSYIHERGIVHRDLKLENFLFERKGSDHLKLIDFGLAKFCKPDEKMSQSCGSDHYIAPEVLNKSYTQKADLWSMGVIVYMMLMGQLLFSGTSSEIRAKIREGKCEYGSRFKKLSPLAREFVHALLVMDPDSRMSPKQALEHPWLTGRDAARKMSLAPTVLKRLQRFPRVSPCDRSLRLIMAWSLSAEDQDRLFRHFLALDTENSGTISLQDFMSAIEHKCPDQDRQEAEALFKSLDADSNDKIEYHEFMAAAMSDVDKLREGTLKRTFAHFDLNGDGMVSRKELVSILGGSCEISEIDSFLQKADTSGDGQLSFKEFQDYFAAVKQG